MFIFKRALSSLQSAWRAVCTTINNLRREYVVEQYLRSGAQFGDAAAQLFTGECTDLESARQHWAHFERKYASYGYRTIAPEEFIEYGAYGKALDHLLRVARLPEEVPVYHADGFQHKDAPGFKPLLEFAGERLSGWPHCHLNDHHDSAVGTTDGDCQLHGCAEQEQRDTQKRGSRWRF